MKKNEKKLKPFSTKKIMYDDLDNIRYGKFGFKDENKNIVIEAQYTCCGDFSCGLCPVAYQSWYRTQDGKRYEELHWGYIDENGKEKIPFRFRDARDFNKYGVAVVCDEYGSGHYLIDTRGRKLYGGKDIDFDDIYEYDDRFFEFEKGKAPWYNREDNIGAYDTRKKKLFLEPHTGGIIEWSEDVIEVEEPGEHGATDFFEHYINSKGEELYPGLVNKGFNIVNRPDQYGFAAVAIFEFIEMQKPRSGYPAGIKQYERIEHYGVANLEGDLVLPAEYDWIHGVNKEPGKFMCRKDGQEQVIDLREIGV